MRTYWNINHTLRTEETWQPNCWTQVTCPTNDDISFLVDELKVPEYFIEDVRDKDERSRYEYDEGWVLIILRIPYVREVRSHTPHTTIPLGIIINKEVCVTVCNYETNMMIDFIAYQQKRNVGFTDSVDLVFRLFLSSSVWYLKRLKQINTLIEESKQNLDRKIDNEDLVGLSRLQDSLTYFATSIRGNEMLLSKLKFKLPVDELDADAHNMRHIYPYNYLVSQGILPAGLTRDQQKAFYQCFAGKVNADYNTVSQFFNAVLADTTDLSQIRRMESQCANDLFEWSVTEIDVVETVPAQ